MDAPPDDFEVIWELDPPRPADLARIGSQLAAARPVATSVLVPENPTGRATVSSLALARRVTDRGLPAIACLNARDRNRLGLRRDLLTAAAEGIGRVLLVRGDDPEVGTRAADLTVRSMVEEARADGLDLRVGVATGLRPLPDWKRAAHDLFVQVSYRLDDLLRWRDALAFDGAVHAGVLVVPSARMARRLAARVPALAVPEEWVAAVERDPAAGVELAVELVEGIRASGAFSGVHLVAGVRGAAVAARLAASAVAPSVPAPPVAPAAPIAAAQPVPA